VKSNRREQLETLKYNIYKARQEMSSKLKECWPVGKVILVKLKRDQIEPTRAKVIDHDGDGSIRVKIESAKENSRRPYRSIYFTEVVS
jgi:hypothetical protein